MIKQRFPLIAIILLLSLTFTGCMDPSIRNHTAEANTTMTTQSVPETTEDTSASETETTATVTPGSTAYKDGVIQVLGNGDSFYTPGLRHSVRDKDSSVLYYDNLILAFTETDLAVEDMDLLAESVGGEVVGIIGGNIHAIQVLVPEAALAELTALAERLMESNQVLYACCEYPVQIMGNTDSNPWNPDGLVENLGCEAAPDGLDWWAEAIGAYTAWEYADRCQEIGIGIADNGFLAEHEELAGRITFITNAENNTAANHGTMVTGIIGAANNTVGIRGVADTATLYCADLWPTDDAVSYHTMAEYLAVINYMTQCDVRVVNNSWGCLIPSEEEWTQEWDSAGGSYSIWLEQRLNRDLIPTAEYCIVMISQLISSNYEDILLVQAAGNDCSDARYGGFFCSITEEVFYSMPDSVLESLAEKNITYESIDERILIVGSVENVRDASGNYNMAYFSNYGDTVDICAPGHIIYTTMSYDAQSYGAEGGTSLSAPMVTGSAAYLWSLAPELTAAEVRQLLLDSAQNQATGTYQNTDCSYPMLNIGSAVLALLADQQP